MTPPDEQESAAVRRLLDRGPDASTDEPAWAVDLIRSAPPYRPVPGRKQRLLLRFARRRRAPASLLFRFALAAGLLVAGGAVASGALGYFPRWVERVYQRLAPSDDLASPSAGAATRAHRARVRDSASQGGQGGQGGQEAPSAGAPAPLEPAAPAVTADRTTVAHAVGAERSGAIVKASRPASAGAQRVVHDDPSLVMRAMRALRRDGDPARARALAAAYLESYPSGKLAEEALALAIEAALARGDAEADALGARYLKAYPQGPFRDLAARAVTHGP